jgi:hypothetical protein
MKKFLLCVLLGWITLNVCAQTQQQLSRWSISLTGGPAIPVGQFAGIHNPSSNATKVSTGGSAELSGEYRICRFFSAALAVSGQLNHGNGVPVLLSPQYAEDGPPQQTIKNDWQIARVLAGGIYTLPLTRHAGPALIVRALAGVQKTRTPDHSYQTYPYLYTGLAMSEFANWVRAPGTDMPWTFSYEADAGFKWSFPGRVALLAYGGYNGCRPSKAPSGIIYITPNGVSYPSGDYARSTLPTGTIHFRAGVEVRL